MTRQYLDELVGGSFVEDGWTYQADYSHSGCLSCSKAVLEDKGVSHLWEAPTQSDWEVEVECNYLPGYREEALNPTDPEMVEDKERFFDTFTHNISHCFYVIDPDGNSLDYGCETPHGKIGSQEFTLWYNELPLDTLTYADTDSWCDG